MHLKRVLGCFKLKQIKNKGAKSVLYVSLRVMIWGAKCATTSATIEPLLTRSI